MAVAALIVSIVALVVAGASAFYARQQARSAEGTRRIDASRRHGELTPVLIAEYVPPDETRDGERPGVRLTNRGPLDLDRIEVEAVPSPRAKDAVIEGIYDPRAGGTTPTHETGPLHRGVAWTALEVIQAVEVDPLGTEWERGGTVSLRCVCYAAGHEPWTVVVDVDFPHPARIF
jgi:hypothetical protein